MTRILLTILLLLSGCTTSLYPNGFFTELASGKRYDCENIKNGIVEILDEDVMDVIEYCTHDPMYIHSKCGKYQAIQFVDWKTGNCTK